MKKGIVMKKTSLIALSLSAFLMTGCMDDDTSNAQENLVSETPTKVGYFLDSAIAGADYNTSSGLSGTTNSDGMFKYKEGDTVTFYIGDTLLGTAKAGKTVTPVTLFPDNKEASLNLTQMLQTMDSDGDPSNGISLDAGLITQLNETVAQNKPVDFSSPDFDTEVESNLGVAIVEETPALAHLNETLTEAELPTLNMSEEEEEADSEEASSDEEASTGTMTLPSFGSSSSDDDSSDESTEEETTEEETTTEDSNDDSDSTTTNDLSNDDSENNTNNNSTNESTQETTNNDNESNDDDEEESSDESTEDESNDEATEEDSTNEEEEEANTAPTCEDLTIDVNGKSSYTQDMIDYIDDADGDELSIKLVETGVLKGDLEINEDDTGADGTNATISVDDGMGNAYFDYVANDGKDDSDVCRITFEDVDGE
jgi:hypothetical protein